MLFDYETKGTITKSLIAYNKIKEELMSGLWNFGDEISVTELISKFGISRSPIMDALKMLENDGFIMIIPQSGCRVISYSKSEMLDQLILSSSIEALCAELAASNHTEKEINDLKHYQQQSKQLLGNATEKIHYYKYNREVHYRIAKMTHSSRIMKETMRMLDLNYFYILNLFDDSTFDILESFNYHDEIFQFIEKRDADKAFMFMRRHIRAYIDLLKPRLPSTIV
ncbi:GntR family transcriptional regulator [Bacillus sp. B15-48]|uniref:GntR family transcriptional regulator n=1 Tax=Bacillus sp. B15-48 TaxID=1548601 RepID=UPI00193F0B0A|nr:GntR family transcriptional regulator [Bacillus sp. B15-48]MBM4760958.1 FCD domain-containing protein [Bacillus sp. B15-48]